MEDPETKIPQLFAQKNWQMIGNLVDAKIDVEIDRILMDSLYSVPATGIQKDLQVLMIEKGNMRVLTDLAFRVFSQPHTSAMKDLIRLVIEKGDALTLENLAIALFSKPHAAEMKDLLRLLLEKGNSGVLRRLREYSHPSICGDPLLSHAMRLEDPAQRKKFLDEKLGPSQPKPPEVAPVAVPEEAVKDISAALKPGDLIRIQNRSMKVVKKAGEGRRGVVFQVQDLTNGAVYALKAATDNEPETLKSIASESMKALEWKKLGLPHAEVLVQEKTFVLKVWIEGMDGNTVIEKYAAGDMNFKPAADHIMSLVQKVRAQGAYIGDFRPANLIWNGKAWVIIDSGSILTGLSFEEAQAKWESADARGPKFERRWKMPLPSGGLMCEGVFQ